MKPAVGNRWILAFALAYAFGLALYWPRILSVSDEISCVSQAVAFAHGKKTMAVAVPFSLSPKSVIHYEGGS